HFRVNQIDLVAQPQANVGGHLVVARTAGVQFLASDADAIGQPCLDVHVHVFERHRPLELTALDFALDGGQTVDDGITLGFGEHASLGQHGGVGDGAANVLSVHALVEGHAGGEGLNKGVGGFGEAA